jgi:hypothetical protein
VPTPLGNVIVRFIGQLESPKLFKLALALFLLNLVIPDPVPLLDEILMGIAVLMLARRRKTAEAPPELDYTIERQS